MRLLDWHPDRLSSAAISRIDAAKLPFPCQAFRFERVGRTCPNAGQSVGSTAPPLLDVAIDIGLKNFVVLVNLTSCSVRATPMTRPITALVVEDVDLIRMISVDALIDDGMEVSEAKSADAALEILTVQAVGINVLVTDISMPGRINGLELSHLVARNWPWIGILILSARPPSGWQTPLNSRFLAKPYVLTDLTDIVRSLAAH